MTVEFSERELVFLRALASMWNASEIRVRNPLAEFKRHGVETAKEEYELIMAKFASLGLIGQTVSTTGLRFAVFEVMPSAAETVSKLDRVVEPEDLVEKIKSQARRNSVIAWGIIVMGVLTMLVTFANQLVSLLKALRFID